MHRIFTQSLKTVLFIVFANLCFAADKTPPPFAWQFIYKADTWHGFEGGLKGQTKVLHNAQLNLNFNNEGIIPGNTASIQLLNIYGGKPNNSVNSAQGIGSMESNKNTNTVYQAWMQQAFSKNKYSVLFGLYDINSEFYVNNSAALFLTPAFGLGSDLGLTGINGPSTFPVTSLGVRIKGDFENHGYWEIAGLDGVSGDPNNLAGTHILLSRADGVLLIGEAGYLISPDKPLNGKLSLGAWTYTALYNDLVNTDVNGNPLRQKNHGAYLLAEAPLYQQSDDRGLTAFLRAGIASGSVNRIDRALNMGIVYLGLLPSRKEDSIGLGIAPAWTGNEFRAANSGTALKSETITELTYSAKINDKLQLQPALQRVDSTTDTGSTHATQAALRLQILL